MISITTSYSTRYIQNDSVLHCVCVIPQKSRQKVINYNFFLLFNPRKKNRQIQNSKNGTKNCQIFSDQTIIDHLSEAVITIPHMHTLHHISQGMAEIAVLKLIHGFTIRNYALPRALHPVVIILYYNTKTRTNCNHVLRRFCASLLKVPCYFVISVELFCCLCKSSIM